jgi:glycosyltransferase involved in cell wall biosynthesis
MPHTLAILGPIPPPHGGIAVHLERLLPHLDEAGIDFRVYNTAGETAAPDRIVSVASGKNSWFVRYLLTSREPVVYILYVKWQAVLGGWVLSRLRGVRVVLSLQGEAPWLELSQSHPLLHRWIVAAFERAERVVVASDPLRDHLSTLGDFAGKIEVIPYFIPPLSRPDDEGRVSEEIRKFCADHDPVLLATGGALLRDGTTDLYGIDMTLELVDRLRADHPRIGVLWSFIELIGTRWDYYEKMKAEVEQHGLGDHWLFSGPQEVFHPVYEIADLLVRPTCTDGDSVSIREALHFRLPTVTSDAAPRPEGAVVFPNRNLDAYERAVRDTLQRLPELRGELGRIRSPCAVEREVELLKEVIAGCARG